MTFTSLAGPNLHIYVSRLGRHVQFTSGEYETDDPDLIEALSSSRWCTPSDASPAERTRMTVVIAAEDDDADGDVVVRDSESPSGFSLQPSSGGGGGGGGWVTELLGSIDGAVAVDLEERANVRYTAAATDDIEFTFTNLITDEWSEWVIQIDGDVSDRSVTLDGGDLVDGEAIVPAGGSLTIGFWSPNGTDVIGVALGAEPPAKSFKARVSGSAASQGPTNGVRVPFSAADEGGSSVLGTNSLLIPTGALANIDGVALGLLALRLQLSTQSGTARPFTISRVRAGVTSTVFTSANTVDIAGSKEAVHVTVSGLDIIEGDEYFATIDIAGSAAAIEFAQIAVLVI